MRTNIRFFLILLALVGLVACSTHSMIKSPETGAGVSGTVSYLQRIALPSDAVAHVLLVDVTSPDAPRTIAGQTINRPERVPFPFKINYDSSGINLEHTYSVQACVRYGDQVRFASAKAYPMKTQGHTEKMEIFLEPVEALQARSTDSGFIPKSAGTPLQQSVHVTLAGKCRTIVTRYDRITQARASEILPPELLSGPHHEVNEEVSIRGPQYFFVVDSDFGQFQAQGRARLRRLVREINAIAALKELALNPVDTVTGIPKGIWTFVVTSKESLSQGRSQYEDRYIESLVSVSKYKRSYSAELGIDVYTSNPVVQEELNRLSWVAATANWTPTLLLMPASGVGKRLYTAFGWTETLNRVITETAPDILRHRNNKKLETMGIPGKLRDRFLSHKYYSPRNHTVITEYLASMKEVKKVELMIEQALRADSEIDAFTYQQIVEILAGYSRSVSPIIEFRVHKGIPVGYAKNGSLVMGFPADFGLWTAFSEYLFEDFGKKQTVSEETKKPELWIFGEFSPRARRELGKLGISVTENVDAKVGMMD